MKPDKEEKPASIPKKQQTGPGAKVFDVRRPGKALASPTSKPVILGHKSEAQQAQTSVSGVGEARPLMTRRKIQIMPTGDLKVTGEEEKKQPAPAPESQPMPETEEAPSKEEAPTATPEHEEEPSQEEKDALGTAALDAVTGPPEVPKEAAQEKPAPLLKKQLKIEPPSESEASAEASAEIPAKEESQPTEPEQPAEAEPAAEPQAEQSEAEPKLEPEQAERPAPEETPAKDLAAELPEDSSSVPETPDKEAAKPATEGHVEAPAAEAPEEPEPKIEPLFDDSGRIVVSQHNHRSHHGVKVALLILLIIILAAVALDILLDLGILTLEGVPHTDFL